ncbi:hypothetical protein [Methylobacterium sp. CM6257]
MSSPHPGASDMSTRISSPEAEYQRQVQAQIDQHADTPIHLMPPIADWLNGTILEPRLEHVTGARGVYEIYAREFAAAAQRTGIEEIVSLGAGDGAVEIQVAKLARDLDLYPFRIRCLELSPVLAERGKAEIERADLGAKVGIEIADLNAPLSLRAPVAGFMAHHSLHHMVRLEELFDGVLQHMHPEGTFVTFDMIGRNGHMRWPEILGPLRQLWPQLPERLRYDRSQQRDDLWFNDWDCSIEGFEGVRAQDILPLLMERFQFEKFFAWGGLTDIFIDRRFGFNLQPSEVSDAQFVLALQAAEDRLLEAAVIRPTQMMAVMRATTSKTCPSAPRCFGQRTPERMVRDPAAEIPVPSLADCQIYVPYDSPPPSAVIRVAGGDVVRFGAPDEVGRAIRRWGWCDPEETSCWAYGTESALSFAVPPDAVALKFLTFGYVPPNGVAQTVIVSINGRRSATIVHAEMGSGVETVLPIEPSNSSAATLTIEFTVSRARRPDIDGGPDRRPLSFGLVSMTVVAATLESSQSTNNRNSTSTTTSGDKLPLPPSSNFAIVDLTTAEDVARNAPALIDHLPYLERFHASTMSCQAAAVGQNVRRYCHELITTGSFTLVSPITGAPIRSGSSFILKDKATLYCFPDEPDLWIGTGDLGRGYPICAAIFTRQRLWLEIERTDWGFSPKHYDEALREIRARDWEPTASDSPAILVTGDSNFAHHAWNQLSSLEDLVRFKIPLGPRELIVSNTPLGPVEKIFPELNFSSIDRVKDAELPNYNRSGRTLVALAGYRLQRSLVQRILGSAADVITPAAQHLDTELSNVAGPILWMSVRTRNRTPTNQQELLSHIGAAFLSRFDDGAIVIDGHSFSVDWEQLPERDRDRDRAIAAEDKQTAEAVRKAIEETCFGRRSTVLLAVGLSISDSILLAQRASIYFCHHGTVQHKIGWFTDCPGMVHTNRSMTAVNPAPWVAAQSQIATTPTYLPLSLIQDEEPGVRTEYGELLHHENYKITDINEAAALFVEFLERTLSRSPERGQATPTLFQSHTNAQPGREMEPHTMDTTPNSTNVRPASSRIATYLPNVTILPDPLEPRGPLYTDFFDFINQTLRPKRYFEIGTELGRSVRQFSCDAVCVDPLFKLESDVIGPRRRISFFQMPSDDFFSQYNLVKELGGPPDISFLDGMHRAEYLLQDFINTERASRPRSVIFMHDCLPSNHRMALRTHEVGREDEGIWQHAWTGDVWKIIPVLKNFRPDLEVFVLDCAPTGLVGITNLDPGSDTLSKNLQEITGLMRDLDLESYTIDRLWQEFPVLSSQALMERPENLTLYMKLP